MYPRTKYEMTEADLKGLIDACKSTPCMMIGGSVGSSPQENANRAWKALGKKMGFDSMTVEPINGKGTRFFTAVPSETEGQKEARLKKEAEEKRLRDIEKIESSISADQKKLSKLKADCPVINLDQGKSA